MATTPQPPITARQALGLILGVTALAGVSGGIYMGRGSAEPLLTGYLFAFLLSFYVFLWYCRDRDARGDLPSRWLSIFMVSMTVVALPYYVLRSRPKGQKLRGFFRLGGFVLLCVLAEIAGVIVGALLLP
jgi:hypothetical protein